MKLSATRLMSWPGYFSTRNSFTCAVMSSVQTCNACRCSCANAFNTSTAFQPRFQISFVPRAGKYSTTAYSTPPVMGRWQRQMLSIRSTLLCHCPSRSTWMIFSLGVGFDAAMFAASVVLAMFRSSRSTAWRLIGKEMIFGKTKDIIQYKADLLI